MLLFLAAKKKLSSFEELCFLARCLILRFQGTVFLYLQCFKILWHLTEQFSKILHGSGIVKGILKLMSEDPGYSYISALTSCVSLPVTQLSLTVKWV